MQAKSKEGGGPIDIRAERGVVLRSPVPSMGVSVSSFTGSLNDLGARRVNEAIKSLEAIGVVRVNGRTVRQSRALARIDQLGLIGV